MKFLGLAMAALGCLGFALRDCSDRRRRIRTLQELSAALELMEGELGTNNLPMPELCSLLAALSSGAAAGFFSRLSESLCRLREEPFAALWREAVLAGLQDLSALEFDTVIRLGGSLGRYELSRQLGALRSCRTMLETSLETARRSYPGEQKLRIGLSVSAALLMVILFL